MDADEVARRADLVETSSPKTFGVAVQPEDADDLAAELDRRGIAYTRTVENASSDGYSPIESKGVRPKVVIFRRVDEVSPR